MAVDERRVRSLKESSRGVRIRMGLLSVEDNGKLFSDVRRLVKNYTSWLGGIRIDCGLTTAIA
jgi:hypothetical protein